MNRAQVVPAPRERHAVSAFSGWVFDLCHEPRGNRQHALFLGKLAERILRRSPRIPKAKSGENLKLLFQDPLTGRHPGFKISALTVEGQPIRGVPDLIMKDRSSGAILIFERKATRYSVPLEGWPNLKVQLWCYSWIDQLVSCNDIYLIGEIWKWRDGKLHISSNIPRWRSDDVTFNSECAELFEAYGGKFDPPSK